MTNEQMAEVLETGVVRLPIIIKNDKYLADDKYFIDEKELFITSNINPPEWGELRKVYIQSIIAPEFAGNLTYIDESAQEKWNQLKELMSVDGEIPAHITGAAKGGLICIVNGIRGYIPANEVDSTHVNFDDLIGTEIMVTPIEVESNFKSRLVVSHKRLVEKIDNEKIETLINKLNTGDIVECTVDNITKIGLFVHVEDTRMPGLIHKSEITWSYVVDPANHAKIGDKFKALVKSVDIDKKRVELSIKLLTEKPER